MHCITNYFRIPYDRAFLSKMEVDHLYQMYKSNTLKKAKQNVLKYFLFSCFTGMRYQDIKELKYKNISDGIVKVKMHKTNQFVTVPLIEEALELCGKGQDEEYVFNVTCNQLTNRNLKSIMVIAEIKKNISFHCGRHSFATIGLTLGIPIEVISKMLGHTDLKTTQVYAQVINDLKIKEMSKWSMKQD